MAYHRRLCTYSQLNDAFFILDNGANVVESSYYISFIIGLHEHGRLWNSHEQLNKMFHVTYGHLQKTKNLECDIWTSLNVSLL